MSGFRLLVVAAVMAAAIAGCTGAVSTESPGATLTPAPTNVTSTPTPTSVTLAPAPANVSTPDQAVARVIASEPRFAGISPFDPELIGQPSWYTVEPATGAVAYVVTFRVGSGDCPSGCIDEHRWVYDVARDGTVTLASEAGDPLPTDAPPR